MTGEVTVEHLSCGSPCTICAELSGDTSTLESVAPAFFQIYKTGRVVNLDSELVVMPTIGPIVDGHILIFTRQHLTRSAELSLQSIKSLRRYMGDIREKLTSRWGCASFYEHGPAVSGFEGSGACTDHAHMHAIPQMGSEIMLAASEISWQRIAHIDALAEISADQAYVYLQDEHGQDWVGMAAQKLPCQYLRRASAKLTDAPEQWDWLVYPRSESMVKGMSIIDEITKSVTP